VDNHARTRTFDLDRVLETRTFGAVKTGTGGSTASRSAATPAPRGYRGRAVTGSNSSMRAEK
jgi:hypothetical protein